MRFSLEDNFLTQMHQKYMQGATDEEIKEWLIQSRPKEIDDREVEVKDYHLRYLREDFERGIQRNAVQLTDEVINWFKLNPHLPQPTRLIAQKFLWASKENVEVCKKMLTRYYTLRGTDDEIFGNRDPGSPEAKQLYDVSYFFCLPDFTEELYRVNFSAMRDYDPDKFAPKEWIRRIFYVADMRVRDDFCLGDVVVYDLKGFSMQHLLKFPITLAKKLVIASEGGLPTRIKGIHLINCPTFVDKVVALFKPFLKEKLASRIHVHMDNLEGLYKYIPKRMLPTEYGGNGGSMSELSELWRKKLEDNRDWFIEEEKRMKRIFLEAKRAGKLFVDSGDMFGMEGSFKKLAID